MENKDNLVDIIHLIRTDKIGSITFVRLLRKEETKITFKKQR